MGKYKVYIITNDVNDKVYVGQTTRSLKQRFKEHCHYAASKLHHDMDKIGIEHFSIALLDDTAQNQKELSEKEGHYIALYDSVKNGYNTFRFTSIGDTKVAGKTISASVRLPMSLYNQLSEEADRQDRTMHSLMIHALREYMRGRQRPDANT